MTSVTKSTWLAVVITYKRDTLAKAAVESLLHQSDPFHNVLLVDNGASRDLETWTHGLTGLAYVAPSENLGPAGAMNVAFEWAASLNTDPETTWIVRLDDDRAVRPTFLADRKKLARQAMEESTHTAGVGSSLRRISRWTGIIRPVPPREANVAHLVEVGYLGTSNAPAFRLAPALAIGGFDAGLFIGFTEVNFGLRLTNAGFLLFAPGRRMQAPTPASSIIVPDGSRIAHYDLDRRYYSMRNEIWTYRSMGKPVLAAFVAVSRITGATLKSLIRSPGSTARVWDTYIKASRDAYRGRLGRTMPLAGDASADDRPPT